MEANKDESVNIISSDEEDKTKLGSYEDTLEHGRVKNIKRGLKRPHRSELQLLSLGGKELAEGSDDSKFFISGSVSERHKPLFSLDKLYSSQLSRGYTEDLFSYLIAVEKRPCLKKIAIPRDIRACVLNWLMKFDGPNGDPAVLQAAFWYLDAMLDQKLVGIEKLQLLASACYFVAEKIYYGSRPASRLVKCSNNAFTVGKLKWAEMVLLKTLNFPPQPVIPNDFITILSSWCEPEYPGELEVAATFLCMSGGVVSPDTSLEYPSTVAAAAVRNAVLLIRESDVEDRLLNCPMYKSAEAKSSSNVESIMISQRVAARTVADAGGNYRTTYRQYGSPPMCIAQKVVKAAKARAWIDDIMMQK